MAAQGQAPIRAQLLYWPKAGMYFDNSATTVVPTTNATASSRSTTVAAKLLRQPCQRAIHFSPAGRDCQLSGIPSRSFQFGLTSNHFTALAAFDAWLEVQDFDFGWVVADFD
jgi:hypothetical protein